MQLGKPDMKRGRDLQPQLLNRPKKTSIWQDEQKSQEIRSLFEKAHGDVPMNKLSDQRTSHEQDELW